MRSLTPMQSNLLEIGHNFLSRALAEQICFKNLTFKLTFLISRSRFFFLCSDFLAGFSSSTYVEGLQPHPLRSAYAQGDQYFIFKRVLACRRGQVSLRNGGQFKSSIVM